MIRVLCLAMLALAASCTSQVDAGDSDDKLGLASSSWPDSFNIGRLATRAEISAWDFDVGPDGKGLPPGAGTARSGAITYETKCASCHGQDGEGGSADRLVGRLPDSRFPFAKSYDSVSEKTIGSYWPYATTIFDYTLRAMPQNAPGSLTADETYSLVAFLLFRNEIITEDFVVDSKSLPQIEMPARNRFVEDARRGGPEIR